jgi:hypothetical protein
MEEFRQKIIDTKDKAAKEKKSPERQNKLRAYNYIMSPSATQYQILRPDICPALWAGGKGQAGCDALLAKLRKNCKWLDWGKEKAKKGDVEKALDDLLNKKYELDKKRDILNKEQKKIRGDLKTVAKKYEPFAAILNKWTEQWTDELGQRQPGFLTSLLPSKSLTVDSVKSKLGKTAQEMGDIEIDLPALAGETEPRVRRFGDVIGPSRPSEPSE